MKNKKTIVGLLIVGLLVGCEPVNTDCVPTNEYRTRPWGSRNSGASMVRERKYICQQATGGTDVVWAME